MHRGSTFHRSQRGLGGSGGGGASSYHSSESRRYDGSRSRHSDKSSESEAVRRRKRKRIPDSNTESDGLGLSSHPIKRARSKQNAAASEIEVSSDEEYECEDSDTERAETVQPENGMEEIKEEKQDSDEKKSLSVESISSSTASISDSESRPVPEIKDSIPAAQEPVNGLEASASASASASSRPGSPPLAVDPAVPRAVPPKRGPVKHGSTEPVPVSLFDEVWPAKSSADEYCFLCLRRDHADKLLTNRYYQCLEKLLNQYGTMKTLTLCEIIQRYYREVFQKHQPGEPDWTLNAIRAHIEEHNAQPEAMIKNVTRIVHKEISLLSNTGLALMDPESGKVFANSRGSSHLVKLTRTLLSCVRGNR